MLQRYSIKHWCVPLCGWGAMYRHVCVALWYTQHSCCHASPRGVAKLCYKSHMANINVNTVRCMFSCMNNDCLHVTILLIISSNHKTHISFAVAPGLPLRRRVGGELTGARHGFGCRESGGASTCTISFLGYSIVLCKKCMFYTSPYRISTPSDSQPHTSCLVKALLGSQPSP